MARGNPAWQRPSGPGRLRARPAHVGIVGATVSQLPHSDEINEWVRAVAEGGDRTAFAALFRHFAPRLKSFLVRSGSSEPVAEELVQETMVQLWRRAASFDPARAQVSTWIYTIARNLRIDRHRRGLDGGDGNGEVDAFETWEPEALDAPDISLQAAQRERCVRLALAELPAEQAQVLRLSFYEEQAHAAIAQHLGLPLGTVKSRIRLAVAQLRQLLDGLKP